MNYLEVKKELKKKFESFLKPLGFRSKADNQGCSFFLNKENSEYRFGYGISNYYDEFYTGLFGSIGYTPIQKIENAIFEEQSFYDTLLLNISEYFKSENFRFKISTFEDLNKWKSISEKFYYEFALPFFKQYNTIESIDKLLNTHPTEKVVYLDDLGGRIIAGLISAKLNQNPKYDELRDYYKSEVESKFQGYFMYEKCMKTINFLDNHSQEELLNRNSAGFR